MSRSLLTICLLAGIFAVAQSPPPAKSAAIEFVKIAPGEFTMGCSTDDKDCSADEKPAHRVPIAKAFEMGKYEVTQAQWQAVMGSNPSTIKGEDHPVETVSKNDAHDFLAKLNARNDGYKYRLPAEAEWEYAARAGSNVTPVSLDEVAWYADNSGDQPHPVGIKKPNAWGLYDMHGNVREWVEDVFTRNSYGGSAPGRQSRSWSNPPAADAADSRAADPKADPGGRGGQMRQLPIMRGGAWDNPANFVTFSTRYHYYGPTLRVSDIGFRVVREPAVT